MAKSNPRRLEELQALGTFLRDVAGRRWMWSVLSECHIWQPSFSTNALRLAFLEGERSQGLRLLSEIQEAGPDLFLQMLKEHQVERPRGNGSDQHYDPHAGNGAGGDDPGDHTAAE